MKGGQKMSDNYSMSSISLRSEEIMDNSVPNKCVLTEDDCELFYEEIYKLKNKNLTFHEVDDILYENYNKYISLFPSNNIISRSYVRWAHVIVKKEMYINNIFMHDDFLYVKNYLNKYINKFFK
jgi:hypothetical protein